MTLSTKDFSKNPKKDTKKETTREKVAKLREKHEPLFHKEKMADLCGDSPKFIPRMAYKHKGELVIGFYPREIYGNTDIYTEFVSRDYTPEDKQRRLYKWMFNSEYATEYELSDPHDATGDRRYLIPVDELVDVQEFHDDRETDETETQVSELPDIDSDIPYDAMTLRDYAAIKWKKPVSHKKWLNTLITNNFK